MGVDWNGCGAPALEDFLHSLERLRLYRGGVSRVALKLAGIDRPAPNLGQSLLCSQSAIWQKVRERQ